MIFDTDVMIWYFRGNEKAQKHFHMNQDITLSAVTVMELLQVARDKNELQMINRFIHSNNVKVYWINEEITMHATHILEFYTLSHGIEWGDALIAATALYHGEEVFSANTKHYQFLPNLKLKKFSH